MRGSGTQTFMRPKWPNSILPSFHFFPPSNLFFVLARFFPRLLLAGPLLERLHKASAGASDPLSLNQLESAFPNTHHLMPFVYLGGGGGSSPGEGGGGSSFGCQPCSYMLQHRGALWGPVRLAIWEKKEESGAHGCGPLGEGGGQEGTGVWAVGKGWREWGRGLYAGGGGGRGMGERGEGVWDGVWGEAAAVDGENVACCR